MTSVAAIASTRAWDEDQPAADEPDKSVLIAVLVSTQSADHRRAGARAPLDPVRVRARSGHRSGYRRVALTRSPDPPPVTAIELGKGAAPGANTFAPP